MVEGCFSETGYFFRACVNSGRDFLVVLHEKNSPGHLAREIVRSKLSFAELRKRCDALNGTIDYDRSRAFLQILVDSFASILPAIDGVPGLFSFKRGSYSSIIDAVEGIFSFQDRLYRVNDEYEDKLTIKEFNMVKCFVSALCFFCMYFIHWKIIVGWFVVIVGFSFVREIWCHM